MSHSSIIPSLATLYGSYLVTGTGDATDDLAQHLNFPLKTIAIWNFDGRGNMSGIATSSRGGMIKLPASSLRHLHVGS